MVDMVNMVQSTMFGTNPTMEPLAASDVSPAVLRLHYAGRDGTGVQRHTGAAPPRSITKLGVLHKRELDGLAGTLQEVYSIGGACSEVFGSGATLAKVLRPGFDYEQEALRCMEAGREAGVLSIHTSVGVPRALPEFLSELGRHLPWRLHGAEGDDWFASLQIEGASAVWAAVDILMQLQHERGEQQRTQVAVGQRSYHGPTFSSLGSPQPPGLAGPKPQLCYPIPAPDARRVDEDDESFHARLRGEFGAFLDEHARELAVMLVEPQWGSSLAALPWPPQLLRDYVRMAQARGVLVCADEIMCGLGRHGQGTLFLSEALRLQPDAVCFGKAIGGGVFPLSGVVVRRGRAQLQRAGRTAMQSHTYAASSVRALMTGTAVLRELPRWYGHIAHLGAACASLLGKLQARSRGHLACQGQGLMWGGRFTTREPAVRQALFEAFRAACAEQGVWPYFVARVHGFMMTPVVDVSEAQMNEVVGVRMQRALDTSLARCGLAEGSAKL